MSYILTVALNAAIDTTLTVSTPLTLGESYKADSVLKLPGGKGINVARVLHTLGVPVHVTGLAGGPAGEFIKNGLARSGINATFSPIGGESRTCNAIVEEPNHRVTEINEPGPTISLAEAESFLDLFETLLADASCVVLSGSLPPGLPDDYYVPLLRLANMAGLPAVLDTSGEGLLPALAARPLLVKPNATELARFAGHEVREVEDIVRAAQRMRQMGAHIVAVTRGEQGAILVSRVGTWQARVHVPEPLSPIGSGDAFIAGFITELYHALGEKGIASLTKASLEVDVLEHALAQAVACGAANTLRLGAGILQREDVERLKHRVRVSAVGAN
ncbi:MAG TPA: 1-phosphofructokinase family hexose kinase [Ktedonobacteraceae bacterium]|nr:1-phosphofructokinase family hexose kinase [Ktedonobacteraceae bacterium]